MVIRDPAKTIPESKGKCARTPAPSGRINCSGNVAGLLVNLKNHIGFGIVAEFGLVKLQPQPLRTLPVGDDPGLGEVLIVVLAVWENSTRRVAVNRSVGGTC